MAQRIKAIAREHGVPTVENVALARALYAQAEVGDVIPGAPLRGGRRSAGLPDPAEAAGALKADDPMTAPATSHRGQPRRTCSRPRAIIAIVGLMIVPLPPMLLDLLLSVDIGLAVVLLLTAIYVKRAGRVLGLPVAAAGADAAAAVAERRRHAADPAARRRTASRRPATSSWRSASSSSAATSSSASSSSWS